MAIVLIGEDEPAVCVMLKVLFERAGHRVLTGSDGHTVLEIARRRTPDLVLLDVSMPGLSGLDVCRALRADPSTAQIRIIMASGWSFASDVEAGREAGADDYVVKPFTNKDLLQRAHALLAHDRQEVLPEVQS